MSKLQAEPKFNCKNCGYKTFSEDFFNNHFIKCRAKKVIFFCNKCKSNFKSMVDLQEHMTSFKCVFVPNAKVEEYKVEDFEPPAKRSRVLSSPVEISSEDEDDEVKCPHCELFLSSDELQKHIRTHGGRFQCNTCMASFKERYRLEMHKSKFHKIHITKYIPELTVDGANLKCQFCSKTFATVQETKKHEAMAHYSEFLMFFKIYVGFFLNF